MKEFDIKKGWYSKIEGGLLPKMMEECFGNVKAEGDGYVSEYGMLARIEVRVVSKTVLSVHTVNAEGQITDDDVLKSKKALNKFMECATGFDAKTRTKREQKKAKEGKL